MYPDFGKHSFSVDGNFMEHRECINKHRSAHRCNTNLTIRQTSYDSRIIRGLPGGIRLSMTDNVNTTWGWSGGAMVLGKLPVPGRPTIWITVGQGPSALVVGAGGGCLDIFTLIYPFLPSFSLSLGDGPI